MQTFGVTLPIEGIVRAAALTWYGHVLRREEGNILKKVLNCEVIGRKRGRLTSRNSDQVYWLKKSIKCH